MSLFNESFEEASIRITANYERIEKEFQLKRESDPVYQEAQNELKSNSEYQSMVSKINYLEEKSDKTFDDEFTLSSLRIDAASIEMDAEHVIIDRRMSSNTEYNQEIPMLLVIGNI